MGWGTVSASNIAANNPPNCNITTEYNPENHEFYATLQNALKDPTARAGFQRHVLALSNALQLTLTSISDKGNERFELSNASAEKAASLRASIDAYISPTKPTNLPGGNGAALSYA